MTWTHRYATELPADPTTTFRALTDPESLRGWYAEHVQVGPAVEPGGAYAVWGRYTPGTPSSAHPGDKLRAVRPGEHLAYAWQLHGVPTEVAFDLSPTEQGTSLKVQHVLDRDLPMARQREFIDDWWRLQLGNLAAWLRGGTGLCRVDLGDPHPEIRLSITIEAPRAEVFRALVEPELVNQWIAREATIEPRVGGRYDLGWTYEVDGREVVGGTTRVLEYVENERLVLDWLDWRGDPSVTGQFIAFTLSDDPTGTRVDFLHGGFGRGADVSDFPFGWGYFLGRLRDAAGGASAER